MPRPTLLFTPSIGSLMRQLFPPELVEEIRSLTDATFNELDRHLDEEEFAEAIVGKELLVTSWRVPAVTPGILERADRLRAIFHAAGTPRPYICPEVFERGIVVTHANASMSRVTSEAVFAMMMIGNYNTRQWIGTMEAGGWKERDTFVPGMQGIVIGIVGYGAITRNLLPLLKPLQGNRILVESSHLTPEAAREAGVELVSLEELLRQSDIVSLQTSLTDRTRNLLNRERLAMVRDGALIVNAGRGELVDEGALLAELRSGRLRAVLDVYSKEPLYPDSHFRHLPNVVCFPHLGAATGYCRLEMGRETVANIRDYCEGKTPRSAVDPESVFRMSTR